MKLKKWIRAVYYSITQERVKLIASSLCGTPLRTHPGTVRSKADQDDAWFFYLAKHHEVIYDVGANVGYTALIAMVQNPDRDYFLIDPNPLALQKAQYNLMVNNLGFKARYYAAFVSDKNNETVKFYTLGAGAAGSMHSSHAASAASVNSFQEVSTVTLDYLLNYYGVRPDLVKIDVEGAETWVMNGANNLANETRCAFFIEMHDVESLSMEDATNKMITWAKSADYNVWYLKTGEILDSGTIVKDRGKCHLLILPSEKPFPEYLKGIAQGAKLPSVL
tara:strand:- start:2237 stop:3070 length:834 start_codon:yes stop_codon:yes gene_type:complete